MENGRWTVASRPDDEVEEGNFQLVGEAAGEPEEGEFLIATRYLVVSPPARMALTSGGIARRPVPIGATMRGTGLGQVVASRHPGFDEGELVIGDLGWQEYAVSDGAKRHPVRKVGARPGMPESTLLHVLGAGGATAYFGMIEYAKPRIGDTLVVSAAAGNVGSLVCQLGRMQGCRVVGIAGSEEKCTWLTNDLGCAAAIDYKREDVASALDAACPEGIDIYFDNVGGEILDAALARIAMGARVVLCGGTSQYNHDLDWYGPKNYFNLVYRQAEMAGFYVYNFAHRFEEAFSRLASLLESGELKYAEDVLQGIGQAPAALIRVLRGENFGVQLVKVS
ncbi:MAG: zinc-binding dehydrogenase [Pseudomonadales bacterium]|nr:NADP-dependent oxidoreductase [Pseudomonadales bacterium]NIX09149.1 zinc-binding dehydrogenase [Pseudomonadales bacterium]